MVTIHRYLILAAVLAGLLGAAPPLRAEPPQPRIISPSVGDVVAGNHLLSAVDGSGQGNLVEALWLASPDGLEWTVIPGSEIADAARLAEAVWQTEALAPGDWQLRVLMTNAFGEVAQATTTVEVVPPPEARASVWADPKDGRAVFDAGASRGDGELGYYWDFGDGTRAKGRTIEHRFKDPVRRYNVTLTVTDPNGFSDTAVFPFEPAHPHLSLKSYQQKDEQKGAETGDQDGAKPETPKEDPGRHGELIANAFCDVTAMDVVTNGNSVVASMRGPRGRRQAIPLGAQDTVPRNLNRAGPGAAFDFYMAFDIRANLANGSDPDECEQLQIVKALFRRGRTVTPARGRVVTINPWRIGARQNCPVNGNAWCLDDYRNETRTRLADGTRTPIKLHRPNQIAWFDGPGFPTIKGVGLTPRDFQNSNVRIRGVQPGNALEAQFQAFVLGTRGRGSWQCDWDVAMRATFDPRTGNVTKNQAPVVRNENCRRVNLTAH